MFKHHTYITHHTGNIDYVVKRSQERVVYIQPQICFRMISLFGLFRSIQTSHVYHLSLNENTIDLEVKR